MIYYDNNVFVFFTKNNKTINTFRHLNKIFYGQKPHKKGRYYDKLYEYEVDVR